MRLPSSTTDPFNNVAPPVLHSKISASCDASRPYRGTWVNSQGAVAGPLLRRHDGVATGACVYARRPDSPAGLAPSSPHSVSRQPACLTAGRANGRRCADPDQRHYPAAEGGVPPHAGQQRVDQRGGTGAAGRCIGLAAGAVGAGDTRIHPTGLYYLLHKRPDLAPHVGGSWSLVEKVIVTGQAAFLRRLERRLWRQLPLPPAHVTTHVARRLQGIGLPRARLLVRYRRAAAGRNLAPI